MTRLGENNAGLENRTNPTVEGNVIRYRISQYEPDVLPRRVDYFAVMKRALKFLFRSETYIVLKNLNNPDQDGKEKDKEEEF